MKPLVSKPAPKPDLKGFLKGVRFARCAGSAIVFLVLLAVYRLTLPPSLTWAHYGADGGDLVTAVARGSIPHPPGFPTYLALGELFIRLPWGEPAWRLNIMSAMLAAGAAALSAHSTHVLLHGRSCGSRRGFRQGGTRGTEVVCGEDGGGPPIRDSLPAICAGLCLGLAPLFWSQALITEVYAAAAFFAALAVALGLQGGPSWALGLVWGVGMGAHPVLVFLAPMVFWAGMRVHPLRLESRARSGLLLLLFALLGWGAMVGPGLLARQGVPSPWGDVSTWEGWWALVSGQLYHGYLFGLPLAAWPRRLVAWVGLLVRQATPIGAALAGLGWVDLWQERRALAVALAMAFGAFSLYAISYDTADSLVYLVPALPLAALWLGVGLARTVTWMDQRVQWGGWLILLLPLAQGALFWGEMDVSRDRTAMAWAEQTLRRAPSQAVLLTEHDAHTFTLWYVRDVLGQRPDVVVVDRDLWGHGPYRAVVAGELGLESTHDGLSPEEAAWRAGRPVVEVNYE